MSKRLTAAADGAGSVQYVPLLKLYMGTHTCMASGILLLQCPVLLMPRFSFAAQVGGT
jgi:hypothetical protein